MNIEWSNKDKDHYSLSHIPKSAVTISRCGGEEFQRIIQNGNKFVTKIFEGIKDIEFVGETFDSTFSVTLLNNSNYLLRIYENKKEIDIPYDDINAKKTITITKDSVLDNGRQKIVSDLNFLIQLLNTINSSPTKKEKILSFKMFWKNVWIKIYEYLNFIIEISEKGFDCDLWKKDIYECNLSPNNTSQSSKLKTPQKITPKKKNSTQK